MGRLDGRVALITGAGRGQGAAEARLFSHEGAHVVVTDVLDMEGERLASELDAGFFFQLDVASEEQWRGAIEETQRRYGALHILINNAGIARSAPLFETELDDYMDVIRVNQVGCFLGMRTAGPLIASSGGGSIVNVSSTGGLEGVPRMIAYAASKHAITGMTKTAAVELGPLGIRVNSLHPGGVDTEMLGLSRRDKAEGFLWLPLQRIAEPEEIAQAALFLASDESSYCTGSELVADGGSLAGPLNWSQR